MILLEDYLRSVEVLMSSRVILLLNFDLFYI